MRQSANQAISQSFLFDQSPSLSLWDTSHKLFGMTGGLQPQKDAEERSSHRQVIPMWHFVADGKRVVCRLTVPVEIRKEDGGYIAACKRLHVFASAPTYDQVIESFTEQVVHFCSEYKSLAEDEVIGRAVQIRELYQKHFDIED